MAAGFRVTPFAGPTPCPTARLRRDGGVWVKDETGNVGGSHKARHLVAILLHLRAAEALGAGASDATAAGDRVVRQRRDRRGTLAAAAGWPIDVFVPDVGRADGVVDLLDALGAPDHRVRRRRRRPARRPVRAAVPRGGRRRAVPFTRAGPGERAVPRRRPHDRVGDGRPAVALGRARPGRSSRSAAARSPPASAGGFGAAASRRRTPCRPRAARRWRVAWDRAAGRSTDPAATGPS